MPDSKTFYVNDNSHQFATFFNITLQTLSDLAGDEDVKIIPDNEMDYMTRLDGAVDNSLCTVFSGIRGIGTLLAAAASFERDAKDEIVDNVTLINLGWLINGLGSMAEEMVSIRDHIYILQIQQAKIKIKEVKS